MGIPAPAPAAAVERIRQAVNAGDYREAGRLYAALPTSVRDAVLARLRRHTPPTIHGSSYEALSARLRGGKAA
jgi:hypothetical protein